MKRYPTVGFVLFVAGLFVWSTSTIAAPRKTRVDFDAMTIHGQTKKADTVYLFDRGKLHQKELTTPRKDYRKEILDTMFK